MNKKEDKLAIISRLAISSGEGANLDDTAREAVTASAQIVGLSAASVYLWNEKYEPTINVTFAANDESRRKLLNLESELFQSLRKDKNLTLAYLSFGGEKPYHAFTVPLQHGQKLFGAMIGVQEGIRRAELDNLFLETLSAVISLSLAADKSGLAAGVSKEIIEKARLNAVTDTAVTVNHEVNNPLTAILGNVQLLLSRPQGLSEDTVKKLRVVEESALKIRDVTQKLLKLTHVRSVEYSEGSTMLDLGEKEN
ncbi:MAG: histidine kinase dimerization/phospho-acceptor domain-containing protein [Candidatus Zixiibacteriota bacterium]